MESVNSALKGLFTSIDRGHIRSLKTARIMLLFAHTLAGYNRWAILSWRRKQGEPEHRIIRPSRPDALKKFSDLPMEITPITREELKRRGVIPDDG